MRLPNPESFKIALDPLRIWVLSTEDLAIRTSEVGQELLGLIDDLLGGVGCVAAAKYDNDHALTIELCLLLQRSRWLGHFYGREGYREDLGRAVKGLLYLLPQSYRVLGETHRVSRMVPDLLHRALTVQLDWSLDDLELSPDEEKVVEAFLSEYARVTYILHSINT